MVDLGASTFAQGVKEKIKEELCRALDGEKDRCRTKWPLGPTVYPNRVEKAESNTSVGPSRGVPLD